MRVRTLERITTPRGEIPAGEIVTIPDHLAERLKGKVEPCNPDLLRGAIDRAFEELNEAGPWPENLLPWLTIDHKGLSQAIRTANDAVDHACLNQDATGLNKALAEYKRAYLKGLTLWRQREQQTTLTTA